MLRIERIHCNGPTIAAKTVQPRAPGTVRPMNAHAQVLSSAVGIKIICRTGSSNIDLPKQNCGKRAVPKKASAAPVEQRPARARVGCRGEAAVSSRIESSRRRRRDVAGWTKNKRMLVSMNFCVVDSTG